MARHRGEITAAFPGGGGGGIAGASTGATTPAASPYQVPIEIEEQVYSPFGNIEVPDSRGCCSGFTGSLTKIFFILHLLAFIALTIFLGVQASLHQNPAYKPFSNFIPLVSSVIVSTIVACFWVILAVTNPPKAIKISLWAAPVFALACDVVILLVGNPAALGIGVLVVVFAVAAGLYSCWATGPRLRHASEMLSTSVNGAHLPPTTSCFVVFVLLATFGYMAFWTVAISCIAAAEGHFMNYRLAYVASLLVSMAWTMQCRMMIAWPQACVAAYHVAYAENPHNPQLGTLIPEHLGELQSLAADRDRPRVVDSSDDIYDS
nr:unnamed protein product [Digitaria exilis]